MKMKSIVVLVALIMSVAVASCGQKEVHIIGGADGPTSIFLAENSSADSYTQIDQEMAKAMMSMNDGHVVVDVRRHDEFDAGHIPGAICIPNESIADTQPAELPDLNQIILVYCRTGRRSKEASQKLFDMGYKNVFEFGGIVDWTGEVVTE